MRRSAVVAVTAALVLSACAGGDDPTFAGSPPDSTATASPTADGAATTDAPSTEDTESAAPSEETGTDQPVDLTAALTDSTEVPGPGDAGGSGTFTGTLNLLEASGELCYQLQVTGLSGPAVGAHIHRGGQGDAGEVVIPLTAPTDGASKECVSVSAGDMVSLVGQPSGFYVNVHTNEFPDGAVRGQLTPAG